MTANVATTMAATAAIATTMRINDSAAGGRSSSIAVSPGRRTNTAADSSCGGSRRIGGRGLGRFGRGGAGVDGGDMAHHTTAADTPAAATRMTRASTGGGSVAVASPLAPRGSLHAREP